MLLPAAALVVASVAQDDAALRIPHAVAFVSQPGRSGLPLQRRVLDPRVDRVVGRRILRQEGDRAAKKDVHGYVTVPGTRNGGPTSNDPLDFPIRLRRIR